MISKTLGTSRKFAALNDRPDGLFAQALYPLLVVNSDDYGRQSGDAYTVKFAVWPTSPRTEAEFDAALAALHDVGLIHRYAADGDTYLQIVDFEAHQQGLHKRTVSRLPGPPGSFPEVPSEEKGTEGKGTEREPRHVIRERFERFWHVYPKKEGKEGAWEAWKLITPTEAHAAEIIAAADRYAASRTVVDAIAKGEHRFIASAKNWLHDARWMDETPGAGPARPVAARPRGCTHTPACASDVEHGKRYLEDMRSFDGVPPGRIRPMPAPATKVS